MQRAAVCSIAVAALASAAAVGAGQTSTSAWAGVAAGAATSVIAVWRLDIERRKFFFMGYVHAER